MKPGSGTWNGRSLLSSGRSPGLSGIRGHRPIACLISARDSLRYLGPGRFSHGTWPGRGPTGSRLATGLTWTEIGGDIVFIEATVMPGGERRPYADRHPSGDDDAGVGPGGGELRPHSRRAIRNCLKRAFSNRDVHIHVPAGAIPKDGPSAGVTIAVALMSLFMGRSCRRDVAMTGEMTLTGRVLPVAGVREKLMAAQRGAKKGGPAPQEPNGRGERPGERAVAVAPSHRFVG